MNCCKGYSSKFFEDKRFQKRQTLNDISFNFWINSSNQKLKSNHEIVKGQKVTNQSGVIIDDIEDSILAQYGMKAFQLRDTVLLYLQPEVLIGWKAGTFYGSNINSKSFSDSVESLTLVVCIFKIRIVRIWRLFSKLLNVVGMFETRL